MSESGKASSTTRILSRKFIFRVSSFRQQRHCQFCGFFNRSHFSHCADVLLPLCAAAANCFCPALRPLVFAVSFGAVCGCGGSWSSIATSAHRAVCRAFGLYAAPVLTMTATSAKSGGCFITQSDVDH